MFLANELNKMKKDPFYKVVSCKIDTKKPRSLRVYVVEFVQKWSPHRYNFTRIVKVASMY